MNLKEEREKKNLTQQGLADLVGVTRQFLGMIENGNSKPSVQTAKKIAKELGFNWVKFFENIIH